MSGEEGATSDKLFKMFVQENKKTPEIINSIKLFMSSSPHLLITF